MDINPSEYQISLRQRRESMTLLTIQRIPVQQTRSFGQTGLWRGCQNSTYLLQYRFSMISSVNVRDWLELN